MRHNSLSVAEDDDRRASTAQLSSPRTLVGRSDLLYCPSATTANARDAPIVQPLLGRPRTALAAQVRLLLPITTLSAFLNNTPVVAMFMPVVNEICKKTNISPSQLFLPMAYAATFGGVCTMIGSRTNLVVAGLIDKANLPDMPVLRMFDIAWVGFPCAVAGTVFILLFSRWLLPDRRPAISLTDEPRHYTVEMLVQPGGPLVG